MRIKLLHIVLCFLPVLLQGQNESHYWSHQYGAKGLLLNGALIGSVNDETAVFYNPGALAMRSDLGFSISFFTPTYSSLSTDGFLGEGTSLSTTGFELAPEFFAVSFYPFDDKRWVGAVTTFQRSNTDYSYANRIVNEVSSNSAYIFSTDFELSRKLSERWYGIGLAYRLSDEMAVGLTQFSVIHDESLDISFQKEILRAQQPDQLVGSWIVDLRYGLGTYGGMISKIGLSGEKDDVRWGLTITSPLYAPVYTDADYAVSDVRISTALGLERATSESNRLGLPLRAFRTPWSFGAGVQFDMYNTTLNLSMEYFEAIEEYEIINDVDDPFDGTTGAPIEERLIITNSRDHVLNFAIGAEFKQEVNHTWVVGFRTDFNENSTFSINEDLQYLASTVNVFHLSGGCVFWDRKHKNRIALGLNLGVGRKGDGRQLVDLNDVTPENLFSFSEQRNATTAFNSITVFFTYDFLFDRWGF